MTKPRVCQRCFLEETQTRVRHCPHKHAPCLRRIIEKEREMTSVTKDRKKYGQPTVYSKAARERAIREARQRDLHSQLERDLEAGRKSNMGAIGGGFWTRPILDGDEQ